MLHVTPIISSAIRRTEVKFLSMANILRRSSGCNSNLGSRSFSGNETNLQDPNRQLPADIRKLTDLAKQNKVERLSQTTPFAKPISSSNVMKTVPSGSRRAPKTMLMILWLCRRPPRASRRRLGWRNGQPWFSSILAHAESRKKHRED